MNGFLSWNLPGAPSKPAKRGNTRARVPPSPVPRKQLFKTHHSRAAAADGTGSVRPQVVSLGEALFDCLADQKGVPREQVKSWTPFMGGAPLNVACCAARLGVPTAFIGAVGRDDFGHRVETMLSERNVNKRGLQLSDRPTRDIYVVRSESGDREFAGFGRPTEDYADSHLEATGLPLDIISSADFLVTGTLGLAQPSSRAAVEAAVAAARSGSCPSTGGAAPVVLVDVNWRPVFWKDPKAAKKTIEEFVMGSADVVKITDLEAEWLLGIDPRTALQEPATVLDRLPQAKGVLVTAGEKGASFAFHQEANRVKRPIEGFVPVLDVSVVDTTGAGDAFTGGFLASVLGAGGLEAATSRPMGLSQAVRVASAAGALTCTGPGAIDPQPTMADIQTLLEMMSEAGTRAAPSAA